MMHTNTVRANLSNLKLLGRNKIPDISELGFLGPMESVQDAGSLSASQYYSFIAQFMQHIHSGIPPYDPPDVRRPAHFEIREEYFQGKYVKRAVIFLLSNGCEWALKSAYGCSMCGHIAKQTRSKEPISADDFIVQFKTAFSTIDFRDIPILNIFNNGSFLNENELPSEARRTILRLISWKKDIKRLLIESRPEFITESIIREIKSLLPNTELEIAIGLETSDDFRRIISINKGFSLSQFAQAADIIKKNKIRLRSYILLKPPFYSEKEGIDDAVESINTAFSLGVDVISLEAMTVQKYTLIEYLFNKNLYKMPWLWSINEVIKKTSHLGRVYVGLFKFYPSPDSVPNNCSLCNDVTMNAIVEYNRTLRTEVLDGLHCQCKDDWENNLNSEIDFYQNLYDFMLTANISPDVGRSRYQVERELRHGLVKTA